MDIFKVIPWLDQYPFWVRALVCIWLIGTATVIGVFILVKKEGVNHEPTLSPSSINATRITYAESHYGAIVAKQLYINCDHYTMASNKNIRTYGGSACETLEQLRGNLLILAQYRSILIGTEVKMPHKRLKYKIIKGFIESRFNDSHYGSLKENLLSLIRQIGRYSSTLSHNLDTQELRNWNATSVFTVDDLFIANGFLEWMVGIESKNHLSPTDLTHLGPFYDKAFQKDHIKSIAVREFKEENGAPLTLYSDIIDRFE